MISLTETRQKAGKRKERTSDKTSGADAMTASSLLESVDGPAEEVRPAKLKASDWACLRRSLSSSESSCWTALVVDGGGDPSSEDAYAARRDAIVACC